MMASRSRPAVGCSSNFRTIPALASVRSTRPSSAPSRPRSRLLSHWRLTPARWASCAWVSPRRRRCSRRSIPRVRAERTNMDQPLRYVAERRHTQNIVFHGHSSVVVEPRQRRRSCPGAYRGPCGANSGQRRVGERRARSNSSCSKAEAMSSCSLRRRPNRDASSRQPLTTAATSAAISRAAEGVTP